MENVLRNPRNGSSGKYFPEKKIWFPLLAKNTLTGSSAVVVLLLILLCSGAFFSTHLLDSSVKEWIFSPTTSHNFTGDANISEKVKLLQKKVEIPLNCSVGVGKGRCPANYYPSNYSPDNPDPSSPARPTCPDYFRWIHENLWPWRETGITEGMVKMAARTANFRLVILNGRAYVESYRRSYQTRDIFTQWGILQLLRRYPGQIPDLDLMFDCNDWPVIEKADYSRPSAAATIPPPPLFGYCQNDTTLDIVFPDWSFWGWPEINIKPWEPLSKDLEEGNQRTQWVDREPHAFWKGNPNVAETRKDLLKCNVSDTQDWNARIYAQDWIREQKQGYKQSGLASQCIHRYKIYIEGSTWSVSEKYILACDSLTLLVEPKYYDFFTRSLMPLEHYWPIKDDDKCRSIKHAVEWGNRNQEKAQEIGRRAGGFIQDEIKMDHVYDYMFHLLSEYAKLLNYKPSVPPRAVELCSESMGCPAIGILKDFMMESMVKGPSTGSHCSMPPPYDAATLRTVIERKENAMKEVDNLEKEYWRKTKSK